MPRRPPTPPPPDDSQFFTVVNPYPEQPQQTVQGSKAFARWMASIVGKHNLYAFYHKPKSPNMIVVEVSKDGFIDLRRLLGEHRWREVFRASNDNHMSEVSSIFPCTMVTPRSVQKECWQQVNIEASWLNKWSPQEDSNIVYPYPLPRFCRPPPEDVMRNPLCRQLRESLFDGNTETTGATQQSTTVPFPYRSLPSFDPSDGDSDLDFDSSPSDELVPTPFRAAPPGLAPPPSTTSSTPSVPAIHGADSPKSDSANVVLHPGSDADTEGESLWAGYGETDAPLPADLCKVHGVMCSSGICRQHGLRKRDAINEERTRQRYQERNAWNTERQARQERRDRRDRAARERGWSSGGSGGEASRTRDDAKGKGVRRTPGRFSANAAVDQAKPVVPPLPPHLRKSAIKTTDAASVSSAPGPAPSMATSPPSTPDGPANGDGQPVADVHSSATSVSASQSVAVADAKNRRPSAKIFPRQDSDVASVSSSATGPTAHAARNPRRGVQPVLSVAKRWADMLDDEDEEEEDEDEDMGGDDSDYLPYGVTITELPGAMNREDGADSESVFSGWDQDVEPF